MNKKSSMDKMKSDTPLDYAVFQLSPKRSRCELFVSSDGSTEKLASGLLKPFVAHLKVAEEQVAYAAKSVKLEVQGCENAETWFTKGTLERFVRFVSTPEVLELVSTFDAEMSQLEAARRLYSLGAGDKLSGGVGSGMTATDDATKKELLRAIDVRLVAVQQDLSTACARAAAAGFNTDTVSELQMFADRFGAHRLNEACSKLISLYERHPDFMDQWRSGSEDPAPSLPPQQEQPATCQQPIRSLSLPLRRAFSRETSVESEPIDRKEESQSIPDKTTESSIQTSQPLRRLSVQDRINMFENKQKENSGGKIPVVKSGELRRQSSDVSSPGPLLLRRGSGASDMSTDLSSDSVSQGKVSVEKKDLNLNETMVSSYSVKPEIKFIAPNMGRVADNSGSKDGSFNGSDDFKDQENPDEKFMSLTAGKNKGVFVFGDQGLLKGSHSNEELCGGIGGTDIGSEKDPEASLTHFSLSGSKSSEHIEILDQREDRVSRDQTMKQTRFEGAAGSRIREAFTARYKRTEGDSIPVQREVKSEGVVKKESRPFEKVSNSSLSSVEDSAILQSTKFRKNETAEQSKKSQVKRHESRGTPLSSKFSTYAEEKSFDSFKTPPPDQVRPSKVNQEFNDDLKMKADELEKLFAEHKLRVPGEKSNSKRESMTSLPLLKPVTDVGSQVYDNYQSTESIDHSKNTMNFKAASLVKIVDNQTDGDALNKKVSELSISEGSRGKFYNKYTQKRDAKLREEWSSNRVEKESRLKSMQDSLEKSKSELKDKLSGSADKRRAERLSSYNSRSIMKRKKQHWEFGGSEEDEEASNFRKQNRAYEDETSIVDGVSRGAQAKNLLPNNKSTMSSSTPRNLTPPVIKSTAKTSSINSGRRRTQSINPLTQSVPNFSELRKENTKSSPGSSKTSRSQARNAARLQTVKKTSANSSQIRDSSPIEAETPIKFEEEIVKNSGPKPFLKKGSRMVFDARASIAKQKSSMGQDINNEEESNNDFASGPDEFENDTGTIEREEEMDTLNSEHKFFDSGSENGDDTTIPFSQVDQALGSQLPTVESMHNWPDENSIMWDPRTQHPFSYPHDNNSDIDASVDSPVGSPISWNSQSLSQMEAEAAARMRKKWGTAQKPTLAAANSSNSLPRKDHTSRGFKRFLKFGRKNRGSENLVDCISATTSEGDDDTEDGRDLANRSSEDLKKSRMGFSQAQPSDDGFNESEFFYDQVQSSESSIPTRPANFKLGEGHLSGSSIKAPRSFFSLSSFRSKGSETKPR